MRNLDGAGEELLFGAEQLVLSPDGRARTKKAKFAANLGDIRIRAKLKKKSDDTVALKLKAADVELGEVESCVGARPVVELETTVAVTGVAEDDLVLSASRAWECLTDDSGRVVGLLPR